MIMPYHNSLCRQAELHYYDFLQDHRRQLVPESVTAHFKQCKYCQVQINKLEELLSRLEDQAEPELKQNSTTVTAMLKSHFGYLGQPVTCQTVKPFLPTLLDATLEIKIPTPITVHLDNCPQCCKDLDVIIDMGLSRKQLWRLGQLLADKPVENVVSCSQGRAAILAVVTMALHETNAEVLKHLCTCSDCRKSSYQYRETVRSELLRDQRDQQQFSCEEVLAADIFDYCFPYGIDPADDEYAKFRPALTSHVVACPECLGKMQKLHKIICGIIDRPESGVATIYTTDESAKTETADQTDNPYAGFPIRVELVAGEAAAEQARPAA